MILIHISTIDKSQAIEIADYLLEERLILDALIVDAVKRKRGDDGKVVVVEECLILGKTKALLFETIDQNLKGKYGEHLPSLYSVPIVHMDWDQSSELKEKTVKLDKR